MPQAVAFIAFGTTATAGVSIFGISIAAGSIGGSLLSIAGSLLLSTAANALLAPRLPDQPDLKRELNYPVTLLQKRFVYGETRAVGSPIAHPVRGDFIYGCWLLNSRPSALPDFKLFLDKREVALTGDAFDFTLAGGATATAFPFLDHTKVWIGRGDQTSPPAEILADAPWALGADDELFKATDAGEGTTVIWARFNRGDNGDRQERWPNTPPQIEVEGRFSKVWDMRDVAQDPDDPDTWEWSDNQALCTMDALRTNPFRPYANRNLMLPLWEEAADFADEAVDLNGGGTEPRYRLSGTLIFNGSEIEDLVAPMFQTGAARAVRVGGKLGIAPGVWQAPVYTLTNLLGDFEYSDMKEGRNLPNEMQVTYTSAQRGYESASLAPWPIPGAPGGNPNVRTLALSWVTSPTQAMRVRKIEGLRAIQQRMITGTAPPDAFKMIGGSVMTLNLPAPYGSAYNTNYEVEGIHPGIDPQGTPGGEVSMRCPLTGISTSAAIYAWDHTTEEEAVAEYTYLGADNGISVPGAVTTTTGETVAISTGSGFVPAIRFAFDPSASARVVFYEWQYRLTGGSWTPGGSIDEDIRDGGSQVFGVFSPASLGQEYTIRVRSVASGSTSAWVESAPVVATLDIPRYFADFENATFEIDGVATLLSNVLAIGRGTTGTYVTSGGLIASAGAGDARLDYATGVRCLLIEGAGGNAFTYSEQLDNAIWGKVRASITADATTAPDGTSTADKLVEDTSTNTHILRRTRSFVDTEPLTISLFAKAAGRTSLRLRAAATGLTAQSVDLDLSTGIATVTAGAPVASVITLASGWFRLDMTFTADATVSGNIDVYPLVGGSNSYTGDGTSGLFLWGMQDGAGSYIPAVASAGVRAADDPSVRGITATLDVIAVYDDLSTAAFDAAPMTLGYWPALTRNRLRSLIGTV